MKTLYFIIILICFSAICHSQEKAFFVEIGGGLGKSKEGHVLNDIHFSIGKSFKKGISAIFSFENSSGSKKAYKILSEEDMKFLNFDNQTPGNIMQLHSFKLGIKKDVRISNRIYLFVQVDGLYNKLQKSDLGDFKIEDGKKINEIKSVFFTKDYLGYEIQTGFRHKLSDSVFAKISGGYKFRPEILHMGLGFQYNFY